MCKAGKVCYFQGKGKLNLTRVSRQEWDPKESCLFATCCLANWNSSTSNRRRGGGRWRWQGNWAFQTHCCWNNLASKGTTVQLGPLFHYSLGVFRIDTKAHGVGSFGKTDIVKLLSLYCPPKPREKINCANFIYFHLLPSEEPINYILHHNILPPTVSRSLKKENIEGKLTTLIWENYISRNSVWEWLA